MLKYPLYNSFKINFQSLFEKVVLGSFKSLFELDNQVEISVYLTEATALRHSQELAGLTSSWCQLIMLAFWLSKLKHQFHFMNDIVSYVGITLALTKS